MPVPERESRNTIDAIMETLALAERLKFELRHSWLSNGRRESVAEHSYQMALLAMILHPHLEHPVDLCRTLQIVLVHDLVEAEAGDVVWFAQGEAKMRKAERERSAIINLRDSLPSATGQLVYDLWHEFEAAESTEARFARCLDYLEVQIQHNMADFSTWEAAEYPLVYSKTGLYAAHDSFLQAFTNAVIEQAEVKMADAGIDVRSIRAAAQQQLS